MKLNITGNKQMDKQMNQFLENGWIKLWWVGVNLPQLETGKKRAKSNNETKSKSKQLTNEEKESR